MRVKLEYVGDEVKDQIKTYKKQQVHTTKTEPPQVESWQMYFDPWNWLM